MPAKKRNSDKTTGTAGRGSAIWTVAALLLLGIAIAAGVWWDRNSPIRDVRFSGHEFTRSEVLETTMELPVGIHPDSVDFRQIEETFGELPYVRSSAVRMAAGGRMVIDIYEREPLAILVDGSRSAYVDKEGVKLPLPDHRPVDLPLLHGFSIEPLSEPISGDAFEDVSRFLVETRKNELGWATLSEIGWNRDEGVVALTQEDGIKLLFGRGTYEQKLRYWDAFYRKVVAIEERDEFGIVDLRFRNQIVTR